MRWDFLWVKIAVDTSTSIGVRVIETSRALAWSFWGEQHAYGAMPLAGMTTMRLDQDHAVQTTEQQHTKVLPPHQWAECVQTLGGEGWELVSVVLVTADVRIAQLKQSRSGVGEHDVQLWLFKRARDEWPDAEGADALESGDPLET